ncbi:hypothetical protein H6G33_10365 [Calothrix sp. FACHB-1219]|uniref:hypothetical protein n=1 Tax=unclassified Calothrix TaxID=2619626 RepID=UPI0016853F71|nr:MULTISPECIES: hypothetical protein [unclassified Calothrix]MBD2201750.1 hypothetical protein [Calothrix sp. FACHB-168]MBD2217436.1 hypothetical protein [Calothrix sp. FACHB-1219]
MNLEEAIEKLKILGIDNFSDQTTREELSQANKLISELQHALRYAKSHNRERDYNKALDGVKDNLPNIQKCFSLLDWQIRENDLYNDYIVIEGRDSLDPLQVKFSVRIENTIHQSIWTGYIYFSNYCICNSDSFEELDELLDYLVGYCKDLASITRFVESEAAR